MLHGPSKAHKRRMLRESCVSVLFSTPEPVEARLDGPLLRSDVCSCYFACIVFDHRSRPCPISTHLSFEVSRHPSHVCERAPCQPPCLLVASSLACLRIVSPWFSSDVHELTERKKLEESCGRNFVDGRWNEGSRSRSPCICNTRTHDEWRRCVEARSWFLLLPRWIGAKKRSTMRWNGSDARAFQFNSQHVTTSSTDHVVGKHRTRATGWDLRHHRSTDDNCSEEVCITSVDGRTRAWRARVVARGIRHVATYRRPFLPHRVSSRWSDGTFHGESFGIRRVRWSTRPSSLACVREGSTCVALRSLASATLSLLSRCINGQLPSWIADVSTTSWIVPFPPPRKFIRPARQQASARNANPPFRRFRAPIRCERSAAYAHELRPNRTAPRMRRCRSCPTTFPNKGVYSLQPVPSVHGLARCSPVVSLGSVGNSIGSVGSSIGSVGT